MNALLGLYVYLPFCLASSMRQIVVSWRRIGSVSTDALGPTFKFVSKVHCVKMGLENPSAICLFYWKHDRKCLHSTVLPQHVPNKTRSTVSYAVLRHTDRDNEQLDKVRTGFVSFEDIGLSLIYHSENKPYRVGDKICDETSSTFFQIDNQKKQDIVARLQNRSDQQFVFAGVYKRLWYRWVYEDDSPVKYTNWANNEPRWPTFAAVSKADDYKWVTVADKDKAGWLCQKPIG